MKMPSAISLVVVSALAVSCASTPPIPADFDFARATIIAGEKDPEVDIDGLSGKDSGAKVGAASGAGAGVGYAAIACAPAFMFYGACLAVAVPIMGGIGAAGGAAIGAAATQSAASVEEKREMLNEALVTIDARNYLATLIQKQIQEGNIAVPVVSNTGSASIPPDWTLRIALSEVSTDGSGEKTSYFLKASATLEIMESGKEKPLIRKEYYTKTRDRKTTAEWLANEDEPVSTVIEYLLTTLASDMLNDLLPNQMSNEDRLEVHPLYAKNNPKGTKPASTSPPDSKQTNESTVLQVANHNNGNLTMFDPTTGMNWAVVDSSPVDLSTANNICKTLDAGDKRKYRVPSLNEFEELWKKYKNDEHIGVFKKREYGTDGKHISFKTAYTQTFSFESGNTGQLYAAYITCVGK
ncbi:MAG: hypothetical protein ACWGOX_10665 [Desulforhopalus sp.]